MINEKNFVSATEEDVEPSYVDEVVGNHDKADDAHKGLFSAINKKIDETEAFYKDAKDFVGDTADKVDELWGAAADAQEKVEAAKDEILSKVSSAERAAEDSNMHANRAAAAASHSEAEMLKIKAYSESAKEDADRAEAAVDKIIDDAAKASAAVLVSEDVRDEVRTIKETVSADALKSELAAEEAVKAKDGVVQAEVNARAYKNEAEAARLGAEKARDDAERFSKRGPYVGDNGNWFLWDDSVSSYVDSGKPSKGKGDPGYTPIKGIDYYTDAEKEAFVAEIKEKSAEELDFLSKKVTSIHPHLKYDMGFTLGRFSDSGTVAPSSTGIVTNTTEPLVFDFDVVVQYDTNLSGLVYFVYKDDGTLSKFFDETGYLVLRAGTKFKLWFHAKNGKTYESVDNEIFNDLEILSSKDIVFRTSLLEQGIYATESPFDCVKEIYIENAEDKPIVVGQIRKNFYSSSSNKYVTTLYLSYQDAPTEFVSRFSLTTDEPIVEINEPFKLTPYGTNGFSGYAVVDYKSVPDGTSYQPIVKVNRAKASVLALNPMIKEFLEDGKIEKEINKRISSIPHELKYDMSFAIGGLSSSGEVADYTTGIVTKTEEPLVYDFDIVAKFNPEICRFYHRLYKDDGSNTIIENTTGRVRIFAGTKFRLLLKNKDNSSFDGLDNEIFNTLEITKDVDIVSLNKDVEHLVMQASKSRSSRFGDTLVPLEFVHFTDLHAHSQGWKRIVEYIDEYEDYIKFALHTGDYSGTSVDDAIDMYSLVKPKNRIIYNAVGNHDTYKAYASGESPESATASEIYNTVFSDVEGWGVVFGEGKNVTYYYKDFVESGIRLIVLDDQQWTDTQNNWLIYLLYEAQITGLAVITASHMLTANLKTRLASTFTPVDDVASFAYKGSNLFEASIVAFKNSGGTHICHLCGHNHFDDIGYTELGVLNVQAECAAVHSDARLESRRVEGTKSFDCFNVVSVDVNTKRLKIIRIGCNSNASLQDKTVLCYDYENKKIISGVDDVDEEVGTSWELAASYTHSGNRVIQPTALDKETGYFTCENHGLTEGQQLIILENPNRYDSLISYIPHELYDTANYNANRRFLRLKTVTVIDENTFALMKSDGGIYTYTATQNGNVDATKFYFETTDGGIFTGFKNLGIDMREYDVKIVARNPHMRISFIINNFTRCYIHTSPHGHEGGNGQGVSITPVYGAYSNGEALWTYENGVLFNCSKSVTRYTKTITPLSTEYVAENYMNNVFAFDSTNASFAENPIINILKFNTYYTDQYFRNGGSVEIWKRKK